MAVLFPKIWEMPNENCMERVLRDTNYRRVLPTPIHQFGHLSRY